MHGRQATGRQSGSRLRVWFDADSPSGYFTPLKLLIVLTAATLVVETFIMLVLLPGLSLTERTEAFVDVFLLTALLFPVIYFLSYRPLISSLTKKEYTPPYVEEQDNSHSQEQFVANAVGNHFAPVRLLIVLIAVLAVGEALIMIAFIPHLSFSQQIEGLLDGILLTVMVFPALYYFSYRPLIASLIKKEYAQHVGGQDDSHLQKRFATDQTKDFLAPLKLLVVLVVTMLVVETFIMLVLLPSLRLPDRTEAFIDVFLLIALLFPALYFFSFRPLIVSIAARKKAEEEKEKIIGELTEAIARIRVLNGLLPICSNCKKIRDDSGYWNQLEGYIQQHTDAEFSHGICPECMRKLYPEFYNQ